MEKTKQELIEEFLLKTYTNDIKSLQIGRMFSEADRYMAEPMETLNEIQNTSTDQIGFCNLNFVYDEDRGVRLPRAYNNILILETERKEVISFIKGLLEKRIKKGCKVLAENITNEKLNIHIF